jgi:hypothetical protein
MKTVLAFTASVWFAFNAATFEDGGVWNPGYQDLEGDAGVIAVHQAARILFVGLAVLFGP